MLYLRLFHGRTTPQEDLDDWGTDGPVFGPYEFAHITYASILRLGKQDDTCDELHCFEDLLYYDGVYYGDWTVFNQDTLDDGQYVLTPFEQEKANLPK